VGVAKIVAACSDSLDSAAGEEREEWLPRKRKYLRSLTKKSSSILSVTAADKAPNKEAAEAVVNKQVLAEHSDEFLLETGGLYLLVVQENDDGETGLGDSNTS
jgi:hypothetical protein